MDTLTDAIKRGRLSMYLVNRIAAVAGMDAAAVMRWDAVPGRCPMCERASDAA